MAWPRLARDRVGEPAERFLSLLVLPEWQRQLQRVIVPADLKAAVLKRLHAFWANATSMRSHWSATGHCRRRGP